MRRAPLTVYRVVMYAALLAGLALAALEITR